MKVVGLTGGIGSGKSTVARSLEAKGAAIIDADAVTKELQQPGTPLLAELASVFGADVIRDDGSLDRQALADRVFGDTDKVQVLNDLVHPAVRAETAARLHALADTDRVVVLDTPLWSRKATHGVTVGVIVVDVPVDIAVERLVRDRGFAEADARARVAAQVTRERRLKWADFVIDNAGTPAQLEARVGECWAWIEGLPASPGRDQITH